MVRNRMQDCCEWNALYKKCQNTLKISVLETTLLLFLLGIVALGFEMQVIKSIYIILIKAVILNTILVPIFYV